MARLPPPLLLAAALASLAVPGCGRPAPHFSEPNARAHVNRLAGDIGSRPAGTDANRRAREYLTEQLTVLGFSVRVQEADAVREEFGLTARVANIIAVLPGRRAEAIGLVAHYDSRPDTPGAADDALGVAVCLEVARLQAARTDRQHSLMVLLTDAEENGLMGAAALVADPEVRSRLHAYVNVEAIGSTGPAILFESGPGNGWLVRRWARAAPHPAGSSYQNEIYRRLPNDTDFTILRQAGIPGLNFAAVGDSYAYHTALDAPERLARDVLVQAGETVRATIEAIDRGGVTARTPEQPVYFDVAGASALVLAPGAAGVLAWVSLVLAAGGWLRVVAEVARRYRAAGIVLTVVWGVVGVAAVTGVMTGTVWLLRAVQGVYHPWYAHPERLWLLLVLVSALTVTVLSWAAGALPAAARPPRHPAAVWLLTLPVWIAGAAAVQVLAPGAAYLWTLPLLTLALVVLAAPSAAAVAGRLAAVIVGTVAWTLWLPELREALRFSVPMLGRFPMVTPVGAFPALLAGAGVMVVPPLAALVVSGVPRPGGRRRRLLSGAVLALLAAATFAASALGDAYTSDRPLRRTLQYLADHASGRAVWEAGANELDLPLLPGAGAPSVWTPDRAPALPDLAMPVPPHAFRLRAPADLVVPPLTAAGRSATTDEGEAIELIAVPDEPGHAVIFLLPAGVTPVAPSLPGRVRAGRWTATYAAAPGAPVAFRAVLPAEARGRLGEIRVALLAAGVPGAPGGFRPPSWIATEGPSVWSTRSVHVLAPFPVTARLALR